MKPTIILDPVILILISFSCTSIRTVVFKDLIDNQKDPINTTGRQIYGYKTISHFSPGIIDTIHYKYKKGAICLLQSDSVKIQADSLQKLGWFRYTVCSIPSKDMLSIDLPYFDPAKTALLLVPPVVVGIGIYVIANFKEWREHGPPWQN